MPCLAPFTQPCSSMAASHLAAAEVKSQLTPHHPLLPASTGTDLPSAPLRHRDARASRPWPGRARSFSLELHCLLF